MVENRIRVGWFFRYFLVRSSFCCHRAYCNNRCERRSNFLRMGTHRTLRNELDGESGLVVQHLVIKSLDLVE